MGRPRVNPLGNQGKKQLLDYEILNEITNGLQKGYIKRIEGRLRDREVLYSSSIIYIRARSIITGKSVVLNHINQLFCCIESSQTVVFNSIQ